MKVETGPKSVARFSEDGSKLTVDIFLPKAYSPKTSDKIFSGRPIEVPNSIKEKFTAAIISVATGISEESYVPEPIDRIISDEMLVEMAKKHPGLTVYQVVSMVLNQNGMSPAVSRSMASLFADHLSKRHDKLVAGKSSAASQSNKNTRI